MDRGVSDVRQPGRVEPCRVRCPCLALAHRRLRRGGARPAARPSRQREDPRRPSGNPRRGSWIRSASSPRSS